MPGKTLQDHVREKCPKKQYQKLPEHFIPLLDDLSSITIKAGLKDTFDSEELFDVKTDQRYFENPTSSEYALHLIKTIHNICRFVLIDRFPDRLSGDLASVGQAILNRKGPSGMTFPMYLEHANSLDKEGSWTPYVNENTVDISEFWLKLFRKIIEIHETKNKKELQINLTLGTTGKNIPVLFKESIAVLSFRLYPFAANEEITKAKHTLNTLLENKDSLDLANLLEKFHNYSKEINNFLEKPTIKRLYKKVEFVTDEQNVIIQESAKKVEAFVNETKPVIAKRIAELELQQLTAEHKDISALESKAITEPLIEDTTSLETISNHITAVKQCISAYRDQLKTTKDQIKQLEKMNQKILKITLDSLLDSKQALQTNIQDLLKTKRDQEAAINNKIEFFKTLLSDLSLKYDELELGADISLDEIDKQIGDLKTELEELKTNLDLLEKSKSDSDTKSSEARSFTSEKTNASKASFAPGTPSKSPVTSSEDRLKGLVANLQDSILKDRSTSKKSKTFERNLLKSIVQEVSKYQYADLLKDLGIQHNKKTLYTDDFAEILKIKKTRRALLNKIIELHPHLNPNTEPSNDNNSNNISDTESENNISVDFPQITEEQLATSQRVIEQTKADIEAKTSDLEKLVTKKRPTQILITAGKAIKQKLADLNKLVTTEFTNLNSDNPASDLEKIKATIKDINTAVVDYNALVTNTEIKPAEFKEKVTKFIDKFLTAELTDLVTLFNSFSSDEKIKSLQDFITKINENLSAFNVFDHNQSAAIHQFLNPLLAGNGEHSIYTKQKQINALHKQFNALIAEFNTISLKHSLKIDTTAINDLNANINELVVNLEKAKKTLKAEDELFDARDKRGATPTLRNLVEGFGSNDKNAIKSLIDEDYKLANLTDSLKSLANEVHSNGTSVYEANKIKEVQAEVYDVFYAKQKSNLNWLLFAEIVASLTLILIPLAIFIHSKRADIKENGLIAVDTTVKELHSTDKIWDRLQQAQRQQNSKEPNVALELGAGQEPSDDIEANMPKAAVKNTAIISKNDDNVLKRQFYNDKHEPLTKADIKNLAENLETNGSQYIQIVMTKKQAESYKAKVEAAKELEQTTEKLISILKR